MKKKYFYGASVQGIQGFIFETNKLKEIAGASELVERICTITFRDLTGPSFKKENLIIGAAGNIKYVFSEEEVCKRVVRTFPKLVAELAPGIQLSQAVVTVTDDFEGEYSLYVNRLEKQLKAQRNRKPLQQDLGWMVSERSRRTGKPAIEGKVPDLLDAGQASKMRQAPGSSDSLTGKLIPDDLNHESLKSFPLEIEKVSKSDSGTNSWIAVIHADGNSLGKRIRELSDKGGSPQQFRKLSLKLDEATRKSAQIAFKTVVMDAKGDPDYYPFRPIILGGDDLSVIIRADLAIPFTKVFLEAFEKETKTRFANFGPSFSDGLTACAGIAYIKESYPFHYGIHLAETLCSRAKKISKSVNKEARTPSSLLFHKVHSSFIEDYKTIIEKELTAGTQRLDYGPYFLSPQAGFATISELQEWAGSLNKEGSPKSRIRNWLTVLTSNTEEATQLLDRITKTTPIHFNDRLNLHHAFTLRSENGSERNKDVMHTHLFDAVTLSTIDSKSA